MWNKISPMRGLAGPAKRTSFGVFRNKAGHQAAALIIPETAATAPRASIYSDGNGKIAFSFGEKGDLKVCGTKGARRVSIPKQLSHLIPFGTRDADLTDEGGMLVLDTKQFKAVQAVAA